MANNIGKITQIIGAVLDLSLIHIQMCIRDRVGACIVSEDHKILSMGYNGFPTGCSDDEFPWEREGEPLENKYFYTTHSELNAILNYRGGSLEGATIYVCLLYTSIIQDTIDEMLKEGDISE